MQVFILLF